MSTAFSANFKPGLYEADGAVHPVHTPNRATGRTINALAYGATTASNSHDDRPAIQAAIDAAEPGDEVYLPNGVYNLISTLPKDATAQLEMKSGVNLRGQSQDGVILLSSLDRIASSKVIKVYGKTNILISNLTVSSTFNRSYSSDYRTNNPQRGGPDNGIYIHQTNNIGSAYITVDRVTVEKFQTIGIRISNSHDVVVTNCLFRNATDVGGGAAGYAVAIQGTVKTNLAGQLNDTFFNLVENCRFEGPYLRHAIIIQYYAHHNTVRGNTIINTALASIDLHGEDEYLNEVCNNTITGPSTGAAIGVGNIGGSPPYDHDASGPSNYIHSNTINNAQYGIRVYMGSPNTVICGNVIRNTTITDASGILIQNALNTLIEGNQITDNKGTRYWGIRLMADPGDKGRCSGIPRFIQIYSNTVTGNTNGIGIEAGSYIYLQRNTIRDNSLINFIDNRQ